MAKVGYHHDGGFVKHVERIADLARVPCDVFARSRPLSSLNISRLARRRIEARGLLLEFGDENTHRGINFRLAVGSIGKGTAPFSIFDS